MVSVALAFRAAHPLSAGGMNAPRIPIICLDTYADRVPQ